MAFGFGDAMELSIAIKAVDEASSVFATIAGGLEGVIQKTADWQTTLNQVQANTTLTTQNMDVMRTALLNLNAQTGTPLGDLSEGFRHITSLGFNAADAVNILTEANKSALSTGSQTADVANILALEMHDFGLSVGQTAEAMNVLHLAAAESNATLEQFTTGTARAVTMAANLGIPLQQVDAALAALSRHESLADANTQIVGFLSKLVNPSQQAIAELTHLSQVTGVDLVRDFTQAGMSAKGLPGVLEDLRQATGGNVTEMFRLIPALRGGMGEMLLLGTGSKDYKDILESLNAAMAGKTDPTMQAFTRTMGSFNQEMKVLQAGWDNFMLDIGQPIVDALSPYLNSLISWIHTHQPEIAAFGKLIGQTIGQDITNFVTAVPGIFDAVNTEVGKFTKLTDGIGSFFDTLGTNIHNAIRTAAGGIYDLIQSGSLAIDQSVNGIVGVINLAIDNFNRVTGQTIPHAGTLPGPDMYVIAQQRDAFLNNIFGYIGRGGGGLAPGDQVTDLNTLMDRANFAGGPWATPETVRSHADRVSGGGGGGGGGNRNNDPTTLNNANNPNYLDAQQAIAAATRHLRDAQDRFGIDLSTHQTQLGQLGVHRLLVGDIGAIIKDMVPLLGYDPLDRQKAQVDYLAQITDHTKAAATHLGVASGQGQTPFRAYQFASEGSTIAGFGLVRQTNEARVIAALERQLALSEQRANRDEQTIALLREQLTHNRTTAQATTATAINTGTLARGVGNLPQGRDPRAAHALVPAHR